MNPIGVNIVDDQKDKSQKCYWNAQKASRLLEPFGVPFAARVLHHLRIDLIAIVGRHRVHFDKLVWSVDRDWTRFRRV